MNVQTTIVIDLDMAKNAPPVCAVVGDSGTRSVRIELRSNMNPWPVPEGVTASLVYKKSDGTAGWYDTLPDGLAACVVDGNVVDAALAPQVLTVPGIVMAAVVLQDGDGNRLTTFDFIIDVKSSPAGEDPSEDYYNLHVVEAIGDLENLNTDDKSSLVAALNEVLAKSGGAGAVTYTAQTLTAEQQAQARSNIGALGDDDLSSAVETALAQAKESGEFDGAPGKDGTDGKDGAPGVDGSDGQPGANGKSAYQYAVEGGYTGTEAEFAAKLAEEMPNALPNPDALTFTGAVSASYDGSKSVTVEIPSGGGGGDSGQWEYIGEFTESDQPTFESGKYRFFYAEAFFTADTVSGAVYRYICIDGYLYCRWAYGGVSNQKIRAFLAHGLCAIVHSAAGTTYPAGTDRGTATIQPAGAAASSAGTAFWVSTDETNYPISTFGIKLWGAK